jgi:hypothetical protein
MPDVNCPARGELERAVVDAVRNVYDTKAKDRDAFRKIERAAVRALHAHIEQHCCEPAKTSVPAR